MCRFTWFAIALVCTIAVLILGFTVAAQGGDDNPIINPGAELVEDGEPIGWGRYSPSGDDRATVLSTDARSGKYSFMIDVDEAPSAQTRFDQDQTIVASGHRRYAHNHVWRLAGTGQDASTLVLLQDRRRSQVGGSDRKATQDRRRAESG